MIAVIDYGAGNLKSVTNALDFLKAKYKVTSNPEDIEKAGKIIFPGVGSFGDCVKALKNDIVNSQTKYLFHKLFPCIKSPAGGAVTRLFCARLYKV